MLYSKYRGKSTQGSVSSGNGNQNSGGGSGTNNGGSTGNQVQNMVTFMPQLVNLDYIVTKNDSYLWLLPGCTKVEVPNNFSTKPYYFMVKNLSGNPIQYTDKLTGVTATIFAQSQREFYVEPISKQIWAV